MERKIKKIDSDRGFYHIVTLLICLCILLVASIALLIDYSIKAHAQDKTYEAFNAAEEYNTLYFSGKILKGVTVSGIDVGGMAGDEAIELLSGAVDYDIKINKLVVSYGDSVWEMNKDELSLTTDVEYAVEKALAVGREGTDEERTSTLALLESGGTVEISATTVKDPTEIVNMLSEAKEKIDIEKKNATVDFKYSDGPVYTYTDEVYGLELDINKAYDDICKLFAEKTDIVEYTLAPATVKPSICRSDLEHEYSLVGKYTTSLSASSAAGRIQNITTALLSLDERVWLPGETFSFNEWVGARSEEKGYGVGVFINEQQKYDQTMGGGICQVSTTVYYCALLCGANMQGRNAPIEIIERRPHTWPSEYIDKGLDATVSWPSTDLKMYNNSSTPYFIHTYIARSNGRIYVNVEYYGTPLPNNASVRIETEIAEEIPATVETVVDVNNEYNLALGQEQIDKGHNGYTVNVIQVWSEPGQEDVRSLITVSKYNMITAKRHISAETAALEEAQAAAAADDASPAA